MSFVPSFHELCVTQLPSLLEEAQSASADLVAATAARPVRTLRDFARLIAPTGKEVLELLCRRSQAVTQQRFGRVVRLFAPLYLSNECINNCAYCGFSRDNPIVRVTLSVDEVVREAQALAGQGFRNLLLVAGEHPRFISNGYLEEVVRALHRFVPSLSLELGPMETPEYVPLVAAGAEGLVVYQETYDRELYARLHTSGPKRDFDWRLACPERAYAAGFRRLGIGALYGLSDWRWEALCVAAHAQYLLKHCWKAQLTLSMPRLRPCAGDFQPLTKFSDADLVQLVTAFRLFLPDVGLVLSTREPASLRDGMFSVGFTHASAGSHTEPGGYTGAGRETLHETIRGRQVPVGSNAAAIAAGDGSVMGAKVSGNVPVPMAGAGATAGATGQFAIADGRSPEVVAGVLRQLGYEPVWKDWDVALTA